VAFVTAILLAAGEGKRMGGPKYRLRWGNETLLVHGIRTLVGADAIDEVIAVVAPGDPAARTEAEDLGAKVVENPRHRDGLSTSVRAGVQAASGRATLFLFLAVDQPMVTSADVTLLVRAMLEGNKSMAALYHKQRQASPTVFSAQLLGELANLRGEEDGRALFARYPDRLMPVPCENPGTLEDLDTPPDFERLRPKS
jgi:CTP:molybdopterin cytidylyltransferase MocA